jgi:hypothetical protein
MSLFCFSFDDGVEKRRCLVYWDLYDEYSSAENECLLEEEAACDVYKVMMYENGVFVEERKAISEECFFWSIAVVTL